MQVDVLLAGGGLSNLLIAGRLAELRPDRTFLLVEAGPAAGGNHTWSFHGTDLDEATRRWVAPLAATCWDEYEVRFPSLTRVLHGRYYSIASADLARRWQTRFGDRIRTDTEVRSLRPDGATLADGSTIAASLVLDGRGWDRTLPLAAGYQCFVGREVRLAAPHGLTRPIIMDATVVQEGGYRFMYVLPLTDDTVLLEDTVYGDTPALDMAAAEAAIARYLAVRGWEPVATLRNEQGALPIPLVGRFDDLGAAFVPGVPPVGVRAGLFHATTGYSLPWAAAVASMIASLPTLTSEAVLSPLVAHARRVWEDQRFFRLLNRMLFLAAAPEERYRILQRFYTLGDGLIARFYAGRLGPLDKLRLVTGRPPVPFFRGLACLPERIPAGRR